MTKLRLTVTYEYEANPKFYGTADPKEMAEADLGNWEDLINFAAQDEESGEGLNVQIEPVEE